MVHMINHFILVHSFVFELLLQFMTNIGHIKWEYLGENNIQNCYQGVIVSFMVGKV